MPALLLIWNSRLDTTDGSSIQLRRKFRDLEIPLLHIYSEEMPLVADGVSQYHPMHLWLEPPVSLKNGGGAIKRLWKRWVLPVTCRLAVPRARHTFKKALPQIAYVVVLDNENARMARLLLKNFGISRYVLHVMDLFHDAGTLELDGSDLEALVRGASLVRVINARLGSEFARWRTDGVEIAQLLGTTNPSSASPSKRQRFLLMTGMLYSMDNPRVRFLREVFVPAWRRFKAAQHDPVKWVYCGKSFHMFPDDVAQEVESLGLVDDEQFADLLKTAQCGVMPIEHSPSDRWRFSTPSRLVDFLAAGLPFMAPPNAGTATGDLLEAHRGRGVRVVENEEDCVAALDQMFNNPQWHLEQSLAASDAARLYNPDAGRRRFEEVLLELTATV
jgi:hypothetical protein